jgi:phage I-like protein
VTAALLSAALDKVKALDALLAECTTSTTTRVVTAALSAAKSELAAVFVDTCVRVA